MVLLLGHIGLRLLMSAMLSLFYLLLAPGVVLAPALGERGRALFRAWAARLFGAVASKLVFAFLLGVVLAVTAVISSLSGLGWWTQQLLLAAFWWGVFLRRNQLLGGASSLIAGVERQQRTSIGRRAAQLAERPLRRRVGERIAGWRSAPEAEDRFHSPDASSGPRPAPAPLGGDPQAVRLLAHERASRRGEAERPGDRKRPALLAQLERITIAQAAATVAGDKRRAASLQARRERVAGELGPPDRPDGAARPARGGLEQGASTADHGRFLDQQARLPGRGARDGEGRRREYGALAPLAGLARAEYEQLAPGAQRAARLEIDRELAARREGRTAAPRTPPPAPGNPTVSGRRTADPPAGAAPEGPEALRPERRRDEPESEVWRDIREVEAGRKRQLGIGWP
jgi:hypothetical protein